mgnify:CR=1 FL=1
MKATHSNEDVKAGTDVVLTVTNLGVGFFPDSARRYDVVRGVHLTLRAGQTTALVGESGCGKSITAMSVMQLLPKPHGNIHSGQIFFRQRDGKVVDLAQQDPTGPLMRRIRGNEIAMIFQEPMTSLNPVFTVGSQIIEVIRLHQKKTAKEARQTAVEMLSKVGIADPHKRIDEYPHQMSGGMRQRAMIAMALSCTPKLLIADEPTTALDVTTQAQIMELLMSLVKENKTSLVIVTHNLGLVSRYSERIYVMYAGRIVESGATRDILTSPKHPYTMGLLNSVPRLEDEKDKELVPIEGMPPNLIDLPDVCPFIPRCRYASDVCTGSRTPGLRLVGDNNHYAACHLDVEGGAAYEQ